MKKELSNILNQPAPKKNGFFLQRLSLSAIMTFVLSFIIVLSGLYIIAYRGLAVKKIRSSLPVIVSSLNQIGIDIAYDNIKFSPLFFLPMMQVERPQIYALDEINYWKLQFSELKAYVSPFKSDKIVLTFANNGQITFDNETYTTENAAAFIELELVDNQVNQISLQLNDFVVTHFADIKNLTYKLQRSNLSNTSKDVLVTSWNSFFNVSDITINGLVNYPLSSQLKQLSLQANVIGDFQFEDDFLLSMENWVRNNGFIDIPNLVLQWQPLTMVGRGQCKFSKQLAPDLTFNTSSKGLFKLLESLRNLKLVDNKNIYVAKILLNNKAYRLKDNDDELTITTPISYANGKISIDNLVIKDFDKESSHE